MGERDSRSIEQAALLALARHGQRSWRELTHAVESAGSVLAVLERVSQSAADNRLFAVEPFDSASEIDAAYQQLKRYERDGISLVTVLDADYPANLRTVFDRPPFLFVKGELDGGEERSVAVVGARKASEAGLASAAAMAASLARAGYVIVSGLAAGIDAAAHGATLAAGARTLAVIGTGLERVYPPENRALQEQIVEQGAVLSQFWPDQPPQRHTFPMRNAVMSGLALGTLVVEASASSGARLQTRLALGHGRPVMLMGSVLVHAWARECAQRPGVHAVESPAEVIEILSRVRDRDQTLIA